VTRDETAWTWWALPAAIAGRLAQRYHPHPPLSSCPSLTSRNAQPSHVGPLGHVCLWCRATRSARTNSLREWINGVADRVVPMRFRIRPLYGADMRWV
jgi:hypothetical protein